MSVISFNIPSGAIGNAEIATNSRIDTTKLRHRNNITYNQGKLVDSTAEIVCDDTRPVYMVYGTVGTIVSFRASLTEIPVSSMTVSVDLLINGVSCLSAPIVFNSSSVAYAISYASLSSTGLTAGQILTVQVTTASGPDTAKGLIASIVLDEDAA